jgi:single-stranded-DNA-specific exonuclease
VPEERLPALAFLNPHRPECGFQYKGLASCGLVLSLGAAVRLSLGRKLDMRAWLDLVAIGTIADVAPLDGDNRALVRAGLAALGAPRRPGLRALLRQAKLDAAAPLCAEDVAFRIAPRLNAPGRLGPPDAAIELMLASSEDQAELLAAQLEQASVERKAIQEKMIAEALEEIRVEGFDERAALVIGRSGWNHGIVGIVAGRLADRFQRPVVVCGFDGNRGRGSVRGPSGARLHDALKQCQAALIRFGGHQAAAGVELELSHLGEFREAFEAAVTATSTLPKVDAEPDPGSRVWLSADDAPANVLADFELLEPCGLSNPAPELIVEARVLSAREVTGGHLKLELELTGQGRLSAFGFSMGEHASLAGKTAVLSGRLRPDRYRGQGAVELRIERIF